MSQQKAVAENKAMSQKEQYDSLRDGKVVGYHCGSCGHESITPLFRCTCGKAAPVVKEYGNTGTIETYTIQRVASEQFINDTPFAWVVVKLDDGPRVTGWVPYVGKAGEIDIGMKVRLTTSYKPGFMFEKV